MQKSRKIDQILLTDNLSKFFLTSDNKPIFVFKNLSLSIQTNNIYFVVGANGCGKSTLLKILAQLENYHDGSLRVYKDLDISYVSQKLVFDERLTVYENYMFYKLLDQKFKNTTNTQKQLELNKDLELFGLKKHKQTRIANLSFGMRKKMQLMLCLKIDTKQDQSGLWLLDEADAGLDKDGKSLFIQLISKQMKKKSAIVIATHNKVEIVKLLDNKMARSTVSGVKYHTINLD